MLELAKVKGVNRGRINDDKINFVASNMVRIVAGILTHSISNHMKYISTFLEIQNIDYLEEVM